GRPQPPRSFFVSTARRVEHVAHLALHPDVELLVDGQAPGEREVEEARALVGLGAAPERGVDRLGGGEIGGERASDSLLLRRQGTTRGADAEGLAGVVAPEEAGVECPHLAETQVVRRPRPRAVLLEAAEPSDGIRPGLVEDLGIVAGEERRRAGLVRGPLSASSAPRARATLARPWHPPSTRASSPPSRGSPYPGSPRPSLRGADPPRRRSGAEARGRRRGGCRPGGSSGRAGSPPGTPL